MQNYGRLVLTTPGKPNQEFVLSGKKVGLGRAPTNDIIIQDAKASRAHAQFELDEDGCTLVDLKSSNGTKVNGKLVERAALASGDLITIGESALRYEIDFALDRTVLEDIHSDSDLDATLAESFLPATLTDTEMTRLVISAGDKTWEIPFTEDAIHIGRDPKSDVVLDHPKVSRDHARIERRGDRFVLKDLQSSNGTFLGDQRIEEVDLKSGDSIQVGEARMVFKMGFEPEELTLIEPPRSGEKPRKRPVIFVPGLMGSELWLGGEMIWPNVKFLFKRPEILSLPEFKPLEVGQIVQEVVIVPNLIKSDQYNLLGDYLVEGLGYERGDNFHEFAYDWRQDVRQSAKKLAQFVDNWEVTPPITLVAHSLGSLVTRYYLEKLGGKDKVERIIYLGGPHSGVPFAITSLVFGPDLLPFGILGERLREVMASFPSTYQILPTYNCVYDQTGLPIDTIKDDSWLPKEQRPLLREGRKFRRELGTRTSVPSVSIFGYGLETVTKINVVRTAQGTWEKMNIDADPSGDDRVPEGSAVIKGSDIHPVQQHHGKLFADNDVRMRLKIELTK